jgi:hypothetical protein
MAARLLDTHRTRVGQVPANEIPGGLRPVLAPWEKHWARRYATPRMDSRNARRVHAKGELVMGEIVYSLFIGLFLAGVGLFMNWHLYREQKKIEAKKNNG